MKTSILFIFPPPRLPTFFWTEHNPNRATKQQQSHFISYTKKAIYFHQATLITLMEFQGAATQMLFFKHTFMVSFLRVNS